MPVSWGYANSTKFGQQELPAAQFANKQGFIASKAGAGRPFVLCSSRPRSRRDIKAQALGGGCPWDALGVPKNADNAAIRRAYRKLALKHHPDLDHSPEAPNMFLAIHEAYEILTGRRRGKEAGRRPSANGGWDFHDWYWNFMSRRRQASQRAQQAPPGAQPLSTAHLEQQLVGLRRKAASRKARQRTQGPPAAAAKPEAQANIKPEGATAREARPRSPPVSQPEVRDDSSSEPAHVASAPRRAEVVSNAVAMRPQRPISRQYSSSSRPRSHIPTGPEAAALEVEKQSSVATLERPADSARHQPTQEGPEAKETPQRGAASGSQEAGPMAPQQIQSQLAGLRRRAAMRQNPRV